jgi:ATP-dependent Zn protease
VPGAAAQPITSFEGRQYAILRSDVSGRTAADPANLANEAAVLAARRKQDMVYHRDFTEVLEKVQLGRPETS